MPHCSEEMRAEVSPLFDDFLHAIFPRTWNLEVICFPRMPPQLTVNSIPNTRATQKTILIDHTEKWPIEVGDFLKNHLEQLNG